MARSNKPILWLPFAAGGLVAALVTPAIIVVGLLVSAGTLGLSYDKMLFVAHHSLGKLILFSVMALPAWHAAHRLRMTAHDLGLGGGIAIRAACYGTAWVLIIGMATALLVA
jgi:fumarate reductase subunit D